MRDALGPERLERAIDHTTAVEPRGRWAYDEVDAPETYPTGI